MIICSCSFLLHLVSYLPLLLLLLLLLLLAAAAVFVSFVTSLA